MEGMLTTEDLAKIRAEMAANVKPIDPETLAVLREQEVKVRAEEEARVAVWRGSPDGTDYPTGPSFGGC